MSEKTMTKKVEKKELDFIKLSELTGKEVKRWPRFPVRLQRREVRSGINAGMQLVINPVNLIIPIVSTELVNGQTRRLRYYKPDRLTALLFDLELEQVDQRGRIKTEWVFNAPIRFVKGTMNSGDEYHQIEILFKQYKYESVFLTTDQVSILESLAKVGQLKDFLGKDVKLVWEERPELIDDLGEDLFEF